MQINELFFKKTIKRGRIRKQIKLLDSAQTCRLLLVLCEKKICTNWQLHIFRISMFPMPGLTSKLKFWLQTSEYTREQ